MTPQTEAGKRLRALLAEIGVRDPERGLIVGAEAEARRAALMEARAAVAGLPTHLRRNGFATPTRWVTRKDALAAIDALMDPEP